MSLLCVVVVKIPDFEWQGMARKRQTQVSSERLVNLEKLSFRGCECSTSMPPKRSFTLTFRRTLPYLSMGMSGIKSTPNKSAILNGRSYRLTTYRNKEIYQRIINTRPLRMEFIAFAIPSLYAISAARISHATIFNLFRYRLTFITCRPPT